MTDFYKFTTSASLGFWPRTEFRFESHTGFRLHIWLTKSTFISSSAVTSSSFQDFFNWVRLDRVGSFSRSESDTVLRHRLALLC